MGCDIHLHIEIKLNGKWEHWAAPSVQRWYELFEKMAGVRGNVQRAIALPRGIPADATIATAFDYERWGRDAHSASYLTAPEIVELEGWVKKHGGRPFYSRYLEDVFHCWLFGNSFAGFTQYPSENPTQLEDVRLIFWFDN